MPECDMNDDGSCSCAINASSGRYSVMYDTSIEANAVYTPSPGYYYNGSADDLTRMCQMTGAWTGDEPRPEDFVKGTHTCTLYVHVYMYTFIIYMCVRIRLCVIPLNLTIPETETETLTGWNVGLIAVGVIVFVAGLVIAIILGVILSKISGMFSHVLYTHTCVHLYIYDLHILIQVEIFSFAV